MTPQSELLNRNKAFASSFDKADLPVLPTLQTLIIACLDARTDPAHLFGLELGDAVVIRNTGGRVTRAVIEEVATLAALVRAATNGQEPRFNVILMQHTQCGAQRLAQPEMQAMMKEKMGIDVSEYAIHDQRSDLMGDIDRLCAAVQVPGGISVSATLYDVATGLVEEIAPAKPLQDWRAERVPTSTPTSATL
jgi:carbonic anhydrase